MSRPSSTSTDIEIPFSSKINTDFRNDVIKEVLKTHFSNPKTKISDDAIELMTKLAKVLVVESSIRAIKQCQTENKRTVTLSHMESVLSQLMLDFP